MIEALIEKLIAENRQQVQQMQHTMSKVLAGRLAYSIALQNLSDSINSVNNQLERTIRYLNTHESVPPKWRHALGYYIHAVRHDLSVPIGYLELMDHSQPIPPTEMADSLALIRRRVQQIANHVERFDAQVHHLV